MQDFKIKSRKEYTQNRKVTEKFCQIQHRCSKKRQYKTELS